MKELLKFSKNLEVDFVNPSPEYQSKMDLAVSSLVTGNYAKARDMFDTAIEIDSKFPSAWLGKAFSEIAYVDDTRFNELEIDEYLNRAMGSADDILKYKVAIAGCLAYRHGVLIKKYVIAVEEALKQKKEADKAKKIAMATAVAGTIFTGKSKGISTNIIGGALIAGGATYAMKAHLVSKELELLGNSVYAAALSQTYLSTPILRLCESLEDKIEDPILKSNFNLIVDSWKDSVIYLFERQRQQMMETMYKFHPSDARDLQKFKDEPSSIQEVGELLTFMKIVGLSNHKVCHALDKVFSESLPKLFENPESKSALKRNQLRQRLSVILGGAGGVALIILVGSKLLWLNLSFFFGSIVAGIIIFFSFTPKVIDEFAKEYRQALREVNSMSLTRDDFKLKLINSETDTNKDTALGR